MQARLGQTIALVAAGRSRQAYDLMVDATKRYPDQQAYTHALARLLAAAPDDTVRDGKRAVGIVSELMKGTKTTDLGETMAMTLAEMGEYPEAAAIQRGVIEAAQKAGLTAAALRMTRNLRTYEQGRPCRTPWPNDQPVLLSESK
jgi:hypothetical protein